MDLFTYKREKELEKNAPLADRMRPKTLDEIYGQDHILGEGKPLRRLIKSDRISSMIFYGPPGTGKTTLASVIANTTNMKFLKLSAVTSGIKDIRETIKEAEDTLDLESRRSILFIDEIHRFNKSQQDALLPYVENGSIILIGATTENPYFEVNKALISRAQIIQIHPLKDIDLRKIIKRAIESEEGFGNLNIDISNEALDYLVIASNGDARSILNALEIAVLSTDPLDGVIKLGKEEIENSVQKKFAIYDKGADEHYNTISAFIKSIRGSDPDAAVFYLAKMLEGGEDIKFIARRMIILASEDIGLADPNAMNVASSCFNSINVIGMPEARIVLAETAIYLSLAKKSNSAYMAIDKAIEYIRNNDTGEIPIYLRDSHYSGAKDLGVEGYKYPHSYKNHYVKQRYLPKEVNETFYKPNLIGVEEVMYNRLIDIKNRGEKDGY